MATVSFHETTLREMEQDKKKLTVMMTAALDAEVELREEINQMRDSILEFHKQKIMDQSHSNPNRQASLELSVADLRGSNIAALTSLKDHQRSLEAIEARKLIISSQ
jgi:hypothetical protein